MLKVRSCIPTDEEDAYRSVHLDALMRFIVFESGQVAVGYCETYEVLAGHLRLQELHVSHEVARGLLYFPYLEVREWDAALPISEEDKSAIESFLAGELALGAE